MLRLEWIRHQYWHQPLDLTGAELCVEEGQSRDEACRRKADPQQRWPQRAVPRRWQTPWEGKGKTNAILYYAQHATACCCRTCIAEWHEIPGGRELNEDEIRYLTDLLCLYVDERMPELTENGEKVPYIRKKKVAPKG